MPWKFVGLIRRIIQSLAQLICKDKDEGTALASYFKSIVAIIRSKLDPREQPLNIIITQLQRGSLSKELCTFFCCLLAKVDLSTDKVKSILNITTNNYMLSTTHYNYEPWLSG